MTALAELFMGKNIQQSHSESLQPIALPKLAEAIQSGANGLSELCQQLQTILKIDKAGYGKHKLRLPFFCCAVFENNIRHSRNFKYIDCCILDFDKAPSADFVRDTLMPALRADERVAFAFISPSGKGAKALFMLNVPVSTLQEFSVGYKNFARSFAQQYGLEQYADLTTSDATRVCFLAHDPKAYLNPNPAPVCWQQYLPQALIVTPKNNLPDPEGPKTEDGEKEGPEKKQLDAKSPIRPEIYQQVVQRLNPTSVTKAPKVTVVPEILEQVAIQAQAAIAAAGWQLKGLQNIQYGKKIAVAHGFLWAEVNVFHGKKGFSIVRTPKTGTDTALGCQLEQLIWQTLQKPCEVDHGISPDA